MELEIARFIQARLDERKAKAERLLRYAQENDVAVRDPDVLGTRVPGWHQWPDVEEAMRYTLADVAAKRDIVAHAERWQGTLHETPEGWTEQTATAYRMAMHWTLQLLAQPYADHPDCRAEWSPA